MAGLSARLLRLLGVLEQGHLQRLRGVWGKAHAIKKRALPLGYNGTVGWRERITFDPQVMGGRPCIRGMRITVGTILTLLRHQTPEEILRDYPYLEREDIDAALEYAAYLADEREVAV